MNHGEGWGSGGRSGSRGRSPASGHRGNRRKSESPVPVDRSLDESSGNRGRGSRRGGRFRQSRNNSPAQVYVMKSSQVSNVGLVEKAAQEEIKSQEDETGSTKQPDEGAAFKCSGDNNDLLQPSASSSSKNINLSGGSSEGKNGGRTSSDLVNRMKYVSLSVPVSVSSTSDKKVELSSVEDHDSAHKSGNVGSASSESNTKSFKCSGDNKDVLQPSASSSSMNMNLSGGSSISIKCEDKNGGRMSCDLVNSMKDVSLSVQLSVSSTSDKKVEVSSVEDHDSAHKSGNVGNASNESNTKLFKCSGDNKDLLQPSASSSSKNINCSGGSSISIEGEDKNGGRMSCDLVNRMEDVSLPVQVSVSSTSDKKIELSSVEVHDSAHKSGNVGNASIESNTRPFDLFLEKKGIVLKPSFLELNKEKRGAAKGYNGIVLRPGMVHLQNYLSINDQVMIVKKCRELGLGKGGFYQPGYRDGASLHLKMMCLGKNWDPQTCRYGETRPHDGSIPPKIPVEFNQFVQKAIKESQSLAATSSKKTKGEDEIPCMSPDICIANFYTSTGRLGLHQDKDESANSIHKGLPVVSFSIGDSAEFVYGDQRNEDKAETVVLQSGDVLLFGGKSRNVFHGVRSILKDTAPNVLVHETSLRPGRLNLTFRQY